MRSYILNKAEPQKPLSNPQSLFSIAARIDRGVGEVATLCPSLRLACQPAPATALLQVEDRLRLDLDEDGAVVWIKQQLHESVSAVFPYVVDIAHNMKMRMM